AGSLEERLAAELAEAERALATPLDGTAAALEQAAREAAAVAREVSQESGRAAERARSAHAALVTTSRERVAAGERRLDALRTERAGLESELAAGGGGGGGANPAGPLPGRGPGRPAGRGRAPG